jgi:nicotinamidase-related amidase
MYGRLRRRVPRRGKISLMPAKNPDLHGNVPDKSPVALVLIDVINDLEFPGGDRLARHALPMADTLAALKARARSAGIPAIYVNDNFGKWQSDLTRLLEHSLATENRGRPMVERLRPADDDYFVLKPKHSGFYSTTLDILIRYLQVKTLILTGVAGNICVLFTAQDAFLRDLHIVVPGDCVASNEEAENRYALDHMRTVLKADTRPSTEIDLDELKKRHRDTETQRAEEQTKNGRARARARKPRTVGRPRRGAREAKR